MRKILMAFALLTAVLFAPTSAGAVSEIWSDSVTITSGTTSTTSTATWGDGSGWALRAVYLDVPTLDDGDTAGAALTIPLGSGYVAPVGWTDMTIGATDDGAVNKTSAITVYSEDELRLVITASGAQAADRVFNVYYVVTR